MDVPSPIYPFRHKQPIQMRFNDIDILGHVNNTIYLQYMDFGKMQYFLQVLGDIFDPAKESLVIVNINCEYYAISRYDEKLEVLTRVDEIAEHSITLEQRVLNPDTQQVKCICRTVMVGFSIKDDCKMKIPDSWRKNISDFEQRPV